MKTLALLLLVVLASAPAGARGLAPVARELARGARRAGISRVAVLPLKAVGGGEDGRGRLIAEEISGRMGGGRDLHLVERAGLDEVFGELALGQTGAVKSPGATGHLAAAEAVVTGVYAAFGGKAEVYARLVRVQDGLVLAYARAVVNIPPLPASGAIPQPSPISAEESAAEALAAQGRGRDALLLRRAAARRAPAAAPPVASSDEWREAPADECGRWQERSDSLQAGVLELKARYWAGQAAKKGFKAPREAPGAAFFDPELKQRFLECLEDAAMAGGPMTMVEMKTFLDADREAFTLRARCGGRRA